MIILWLLSIIKFIKACIFQEEMTNFNIPFICVTIYFFSFWNRNQTQNPALSRQALCCWAMSLDPNLIILILRFEIPFVISTRTSIDNWEWMYLARMSKPKKSLVCIYNINLQHVKIPYARSCQFWELIFNSYERHVLKQWG